MRALVVDDSRAIRMILARMLADLGMVVLEAGDTEAALLLLEAQGPFDLLLADWDLPGADGFELVELANATDHAPRVAIVTVPRGRVDLIAQARAAGADGSVSKPTSRLDLDDLLESHGLNRRAA